MIFECLNQLTWDIFSVIKLYFLVLKPNIDNASIWLYKAVRCEQVEIAQWLLETYPFKPKILRTVLLQSIHHNSIQVAEMLVKRGIKEFINIPSDQMSELLNDFDCTKF